MGLIFTFASDILDKSECYKNFEEEEYYMRTKKFLSILLAVIMTLGVCGIGVSAVELTGEEAVVEQLKWSDMNTAGKIILNENTAHSKGMGTAEIVWVPFTATDGTLGGVDSFYTLYNKNPKEVTLKLEAWRVESDGDIPIAIHVDKPLAATTTGAYFDVSSSALTVTIGQASTKWYGTVKVKVTVSYPGAPAGTATELIGEYTVKLSNNKDIAEKINQAKEEAKKDDRYTKAYLTNLNSIISSAESLIQGRPTEDQILRYIGYLENAINGLDANGVSVGKIYQLSKIEFIDKLFSDSFLAGLWKVIDVFNSIMSVVNPVIDFFGQVGDFFGNLMPIFTFIFGFLFP